ncbi:hypothetical protein HHI36_017584 [Cryptolaemus montrouzieri]|uniref:Uncharacterized protein n=1 Tax=Cryptolaemus montrouzieri TaxID=559131 RepID=A0ABD2NN30_9CUCU
MDLIELSSEMTRLRRDDQYLVTLKIRSSLNARSTENPKEPPLNSDHITSNMEPDITTQSNRLKADSKYILGPRAYILTNISVKNKPKNTSSAISGTEIQIVNL